MSDESITPPGTEGAFAWGMGLALVLTFGIILGVTAILSACELPIPDNLCDPSDVLVYDEGQRPEWYCTYPPPEPVL